MMLTPAIRLAMIFLSTGVVYAQSREVTNDSLQWSLGAGCPTWSLLPAGEISVCDQATKEVASGASLISGPGGMHEFGDHCVFCGVDGTGVGRIELWRFDRPSSLVLVDSRVDPARRYTGVAATGGKLLLLDAVNDQIVAGPWIAPSPLSAVTFNVVADSATPHFPDPDDWTLDADLSGRIFIQSGSGDVEMGFTVVGDGSSPLSLIPPPAHRPGVSAYIRPVSTSEGDATVQVVAGNNVAFDVVRLGTGVIGSGVGIDVNSPVTVALTEALIMGERYVARAVGAPTPVEYAFECVRRYGQSESLADGTQMQPFFYLAGAETGQMFNIHLALLNGAPSVAAQQYSGELLIGFRLPNDPVLPLQDGRYLLAPTFQAPVTGWMQQDAIQGGISAAVPIPNGVTDFVFLVQFVIYEGSEFKLSQVYGALIH